MKLYRNVVAPGYFSLMRIPLLDGRDFTEHDDERSQPVMIVNETFVRRYFAGANPIGRRVNGCGDWFTIVGVAKDSKYNHLAEPPMPYFYVPFRQVYRADMSMAFYVRTKANLSEALTAVRTAVHDIDPNVAILDAVPLSEYISASLYPQRVMAMLIGALGILALVLAAVGLYSVMAYSVTQRTHEIGVRMALGARPTDVLILVVRQALRLTAAGLFFGAAIAIGLSRSIGSVLFGVSSSDPVIYTTAMLFLAFITCLASYIPALRASHVDPMISLRHQ
jgi:predicted permease